MGRSSNIPVRFEAGAERLFSALMVLVAIVSIRS
jgi:hypothetical protein